MGIAKYEYPIANTLEFINGEQCQRDTREHLESLYALLLLKAKDNQEYSSTAREELSKEAVNNLKNSKIYRTDEDGSIMFKIKNNKLKIEIYSP